MEKYVIRVALATLDWTREKLRSRVRGVRNKDLLNLLQGGTNGLVKSQVFEVLRQAGCDPEDASQLITRTKENARRAKEVGTQSRSDES